jgi:hypothetical protein
VIARGNGFDRNEMNPCAGSGNGIIPDTADAAAKAKLETAAGKARDGIATNDVAAAKADASAAADIPKGLK